MTTGPETRQSKRKRRFRREMRMLGWLIALGFAGLVAARWLAHDAMILLVWVNSFTLYFYLPAYPLAAVALWRRCWAMAAVAGLVAACHLHWVLPGVVASPAPDPAAENMLSLRVFSANLYAGNSRPELLIAEIRDAEADILVFQEITPKWWSELESAGLFEEYPHLVKKRRRDAFGSAILSRWPLEDVEFWLVDELPMNLSVPMIRCTVVLDGARLRLYNVHPLPPASTDYIKIWNRQHEQLVEKLDAETGPTLAIGDFNATQHSRWHQRHTAGRMRSAHVDRGRGMAVSWPNGRSLLPPIRIDHALLSPEIGCLDVREGEGAGSDHKPLIVDLLLPKD
ncbi:MAG: endonuclease/exonuclease/phosphatase family protein [Planctomycetes bacterium]|nr:endonuclease/exonuclease/phosphatase family protein [Planctomycetota bacterium]